MASIRPPSDPTRRASTGLKTPTTNELTAGVDHQVTDDFAVSATFSYRNTADLQEHLPVGASLSTYAFLGRAQGTASGERLDAQLRRALLRFHWRSPGTVHSEHRAVEPSRRHAEVLRGGCVDRQTPLPQLDVARRPRLEQLPAISDGAVDPESEQPRGALDRRRRPERQRGARERFINASWQFNISGLYQGPWGLTFGANFFGRQGYPNPYSVQVFTQDLYSSQNFLIGKVDDYRYPNVYELDFRLQRSFRIGPVTVIPAVELFNVTNNNTVLSRDQTVGATTATARSLRIRPSTRSLGPRARASCAWACRWISSGLARWLKSLPSSRCWPRWRSPASPDGGRRETP